MCLPKGHTYNKTWRFNCLTVYNLLIGSILNHNLLGKIKKRNAMTINCNEISILLAFSLNILYEAVARLLLFERTRSSTFSQKDFWRPFWAIAVWNLSIMMCINTYRNWISHQLKKCDNNIIFFSTFNLLDIYISLSWYNHDKLSLSCTNILIWLAVHTIKNLKDYNVFYST